MRSLIPRLGTRKPHYFLSKQFIDDEIKVGRDRLFDLLREEGLLIKKKRRYAKTTDSKHWMRRYPNLIKDMTIERPEQVWVADFTYVPVGAGLNYLQLVTDAYSKKVMG